MQRTNNYGLCQYEGSDKTSYLVNYNDDMLKIDTAIKAASDGAASAQTKADTADGKADTNALNISTLNTQINGEGGVAADVSTLQGAMNTVTSLIGNGQPTTTDKTLIGAINELHTDEQTLEAYYGKIPNIVEYRTSRVEVAVTADGVKTCAELLHDLHSAVQSLVNNLDDNEGIEILQCSLNDHAYSMNTIAKYFNTKNTTVGNIVFEKTNNTPSNITFYSASIRADEYSYYYDHTLSVADSSVVVTTYSNTVPAQGVKYGILCQKYNMVSKS